MSVSLVKRFLLGTLGAPAGVLGSGVEGPRRNQLLMAQMIKILEKYNLTVVGAVVGKTMAFDCSAILNINKTSEKHRENKSQIHNAHIK